MNDYDELRYNLDSMRIIVLGIICQINFENICSGNNLKNPHISDHSCNTILFSRIGYETFLTAIQFSYDLTILLLIC